ncbi:MAG: serine/threonine protein phosphatase [Myxococcaceae bacterium]|nr:serine/threonine protein phosphatase [Myxococcaceae bacterium]
MGTRHIIIGDIHGCHDELLELCDRVALTASDILVSVGDLVDRGPEPGKVLRFFRERPGAVVIMGNHERKHVRQVFSFSQEITRLQLGDDYAEAVRWMSRLPYWYETDEIVVVHAALMPGLALSKQRDEVVSGTTSGERELSTALGDRRWYELYQGPKPVVVGHHVVLNGPQVHRDLVYCIDTGACHGGSLTALIVPTFELVSVKARDDHWKRTKQTWQRPVLLAKAWPEMSFSKARRELERLGEERSAAVEAIEAWLVQVEALRPACLERLIALAGDASTEVEAHPLRTLLHMARSGRLDLDGVKERCPTPKRTLEIAAAVGLPLPAAPCADGPANVRFAPAGSWLAPWQFD